MSDNLIAGTGSATPLHGLILTKIYSYTEQGPSCPARITIKRDQFGHFYIEVRGRGEVNANASEVIRLSPDEFSAISEHAAAVGREKRDAALSDWFRLCAQDGPFP